MVLFGLALKAYFEHPTPRGLSPLRRGIQGEDQLPAVTQSEAGNVKDEGE